MAEIACHKSCRGKDSAADDVADEHARGCEPADTARKCGLIALRPVHQYARLLRLLFRMNERNEPNEGESFSLIALCCPVIEIKRLDVSADRQDQPTTDG